jgi:hypothetical protein
LRCLSEVGRDRKEGRQGGKKQEKEGRQEGSKEGRKEVFSSFKQTAPH